MKKIGVRHETDILVFNDTSRVPNPLDFPTSRSRNRIPRHRRLRRRRSIKSRQPLGGQIQRNFRHLVLKFTLFKLSSFAKCRFSLLM